MEVIDVLFDNTNFCLGGEIHKQITGISISPESADLVMADLEDFCLQKLENWVATYCFLYVTLMIPFYVFIRMIYRLF